MEKFELMREHTTKMDADILIVIIIIVILIVKSVEEAETAIVVAAEETWMPIGNAVTGRDRTMVRSTVWMTSSPMTIKWI